MRLLLLLILSITVTSAWTQSGVRFEKYDIRDGLSQTIVNCIEQDNDGFLWVGTQDGLNRFDGYDFKVFKPDPFDNNSLSDNYVNDILLDNRNNLWVATEAGLNLYDSELEQFIQIAESDTSLSYVANLKIRDLYQSDNGIIWLSTKSSGLIAITSYHADNRIFKLKALESERVEPTDIYATFEKKEKVYVGTDKGLFVLGMNHLIPVQHKGEHFSSLVRRISKIEDEIWLSTNGGAFRVELENDQVEILAKVSDKNGLITNVVNDVYHHNEIFWIATDYGLSQVQILGEDTVCNNLSSKDISRYNSDDTKVSCFLKDRYGSLWIGTDRGLNRFDEKVAQFKLYRNIPDRPNTLQNNSIWSFDAYQNKVYVGTQTGLSVLNKSKGTFKNYTSENSDIPEGSISNIFIDSKKRLWVGSSSKEIRLFDASSMRYLGNVEYLPNPDEFEALGLRTFTVLEDYKGRFWIGGENGLSLLDKNLKLIEHFFPNEDEYSLSHDIVRHLFMDSRRNIWVGTDGGGLNRVIEGANGKIEFEVFQYDLSNRQGLNHNMVLSIAEDFYGNIWCATYGGGVNKYVLEEKRFYHITEKQGLSNNVVYGLVRDSQGNIWASTNKGLSQINPINHNVRVFTEKSGLQSDEFNIGAFHFTKDDEVLFGGINGFNLFRPDNITSNQIPPDLAIKSMDIFGEPIELADHRLMDSVGHHYELNLDHTQNTINFDFVGLHYSSPKDNWYKFKLEGFQDEWVIAKNRRFASYSNLDYGEYTFKVTAANSDRIWNPEMIQVHLNIRPPFYHTWLFRILIAILIIGIFFAIYYSRLAMIRTQKRLLEQKVTARTQKVLEQKKKIEIQKELIEQEKHKAETLLLNILPAETADELIRKGKASPRHYRMTTVMFCDFKGFTKIAERLEPQALIDELDYCFNAFDDIMEKYNIEKIKTSGDAYMAAGGIPIRNKTNPIDMVLAAIEIQRFMHNHKKMKLAEGKEAWELRVGIHTGEAIAGVVGKKKFAYDIWGDTVNTASRMESASEPGKINISGSTFRFVEPYFETLYRGKVPAKNKGEVDMYYVKGIRKELSIDGKGEQPNEKFQRLISFNVFSRLNYNQVRKYLLGRLEADLPKNLHYHGVHHTRDVISAAERIARSEGMDDESTMVIKTAALFHDAGFLRKYWKNEPQGVELAREILPQYDYTQEQIDLIESMILATAIPQKPTNIYEEILCDADLDYLGRDDFEEISQSLCKELIEYGKISSQKEWDGIQVKFLKKHKYFTKTNKETRTAKKLKHLEEVKERVKRRKKE